MFEFRSLLAPAAAAMLALPFGRQRGPEDKQVRAAYMFHGSGDPIAMVTSDEVPPVSADALEPIFVALREFVDTAVPGSRGLTITTPRSATMASSQSAGNM